MTHINQPQPRERGILYQGSMVRALLAGTKTQTRRIFKLPRGHSWDELQGGMASGNIESDRWPGTWHASEFRCPYGAPGDRLWVRESFKKIIGNSGYWIETDYRATYKHGDRLGDHLGEKHKWTPSIHMPRAASRILLEITAVRVERLQDISEADAQAEGIDCMHLPSGNKAWLDYSRPLDGAGGHWFQEAAVHAAPVLSYQSLWKSIHGEESWAANPRVWAVSFKVVQP